MLLLDALKMPREIGLHSAWQHRDPIPVAFAAAHGDLVSGEVDVLDSEAGAFEQAKAGAVQQNRHQPRRPLKFSDDGAHLVPG